MFEIHRVGTLLQRMNDAAIWTWLGVVKVVVCWKDDQALSVVGRVLVPLGGTYNDAPLQLKF